MPGTTKDKATMIAANGGTNTQHPNWDWRNFMIAQGGTGTYDEQEAEMKFLASKGYTQATFYDRSTAYLAAKGYSTGTHQEKYTKWLQSGTL